MVRKTILFLAVIFLIVYTSTGLSSDLAYAPGELLVKFAPNPDGKQRTIAEQNAISASISGGMVKRCYQLVPGLTLVFCYS